jgi:hypothetical protein
MPPISKVVRAAHRPLRLLRVPLQLKLLRRLALTLQPAHPQQLAAVVALATNF